MTDRSRIDAIESTLYGSESPPLPEDRLPPIVQTVLETESVAARAFELADHADDESRRALTQLGTVAHDLDAVLEQLGDLDPLVDRVDDIEQSLGKVDPQLTVGAQLRFQGEALARIEAAQERSALLGRQTLDLMFKNLLCTAIANDSGMAERLARFEQRELSGVEMQQVAAAILDSLRRDPAIDLDDPASWSKVFRFT